MDQSKLFKNAYILLTRLERLSADSIWAHKASGLRGSLIRCLEKEGWREEGNLEALVDQGFDLLAKAAREIPDLGDG